MTKQSKYTLENIILFIIDFTIITVITTPLAYIPFGIIHHEILINYPNYKNILQKITSTPITYGDIITGTIEYTTLNIIILFWGIIIAYYGTGNDKKFNIIHTLLPSDALIAKCVPYSTLQLISLISGIPLLAYHFGYPIPRYIGITAYIAINLILIYTPHYIYNRTATNKQFNNIFQQLSAHNQVETIRQIGIKKSTNIHIPYKQKQKFIQHHESSSIPHTP